MTNITIAGQPVLIDYKREILNWLETYLEGAVDDPFFNPPHDLRGTAPDGNGEDQYFASNLPALPPIRLGSIQWPVVGASRFARGLFLADSIGTYAIMNASWVAPPPEPDPEEEDPPEEEEDEEEEPTHWGRTADFPVDVVVDPEAPLTLKMYLLPPIQIAADLWILRLVDQRFKTLRKHGPIEGMANTRPITSWDSLFDQFVYHGFDISHPTTIDAALGVPDLVFAKSSAPISAMVDAAAFSIGTRPVFSPWQTTLPTIKVDFEAHSAATTKRTALLYASRTTGGDSTVPDLAKSLTFLSPLAKSYCTSGRSIHQTVKALDGFAPEQSMRVMMAHHVAFNMITMQHDIPPFSIALTQYTDAIAATYTAETGWNRLEYSITIPDTVAVPASGHDDYIEWTWSDRGKTTQIKSLPATFYPTALLAQVKSVTEDISYPCAWFTTPKDYILGKVITASTAGSIHSGSKVWDAKFTDVQLYDESLMIPGVPPTFRYALVKALVATEGALAAGELVELHYCQTPVIVSGTTVTTFEGWSIRKHVSGGGSPEPEDQGTAFTLTAVPTYSAHNLITTAAATILKPDGTTGTAITVKFIGRVRGRIGSRGVAVKQDNQWIATSLQQPALKLRGALTAILRPTDATATVQVNQTRGLFPDDYQPTLTSGNLSVSNPKNLCGFSGAIVELEYDSLTDSYFIDSIQKHATRVIGIVQSGFSDSNAFASIDNLDGIDGIVLPALVSSGPLEVQNVHLWSGDTGAKARAEFNWDSLNWELYQITCP